MCEYESFKFFFFFDLGVDENINGIVYNFEYDIIINKNYLNCFWSKILLFIVINIYFVGICKVDFIVFF